MLVIIKRLNVKTKTDTSDMKVKIGNTIYDSEKEPIMIILSDKDKENISNMHKDATRFCSFPESIDTKFIENWMDDLN